MNRFKTQLMVVTFLLFFGSCISIIAAPLNGKSFDLEQPDGSLVPVLVWGDEFFQHIESPDGFTLVRNKENGWICYAKLSSDSSDLISTGEVYHYSATVEKSTDDSSAVPMKKVKISRTHRLLRHEMVRKILLEANSSDTQTSQLPAPSMGSEDSSVILPLPGVTPTSGNFKGLTIIIDFSDKTGSLPVDSIKNFVNKQGYTGYGNNGSVRDFFYDVSGGKVDYQNEVVGYYRAKNQRVIMITVTPRLAPVQRS